MIFPKYMDLVLDIDDMIDYIKKKTNYKYKVISDILDAETHYLVSKGFTTATDCQHDSKFLDDDDLDMFISEKTQINLLIVETVMNHNHDYMKSHGFHEK